MRAQVPDATDAARSDETAQAVPAKPARGSIRATAVVIYASLGLLALTIPHSIANWLRGAESAVLRRLAVPVADAIDEAARVTGAGRPYAWAHQIFLQTFNKQD
jgi:hypothetical protein